MGDPYRPENHHKAASMTEKWRARAEKYTGYLGGFDQEWKNPPAPLNPDYDPKAASRASKVSASMERDGFYANHTRAECKTEWARRYDELRLAEIPCCD